jgi:TolB protein
VLGADYDPVWSPDDDHVAFVSQQEQNDEIHIYEFSINWDRRLTESPQLDKHPTFSPDGTNIAFWSDRTGQRQIWVMDLNGENQRNISNNAHNDWKPVWWKPRPICQPQ